MSELPTIIGRGIDFSQKELKVKYIIRDSGVVKVVFTNKYYWCPTSEEVKELLK